MSTAALDNMQLMRTFVAVLRKYRYYNLKHNKAKIHHKLSHISPEKIWGAGCGWHRVITKREGWHIIEFCLLMIMVRMKVSRERVETGKNRKGVHRISSQMWWLNRLEWIVAGGSWRVQSKRRWNWFHWQWRMNSFLTHLWTNGININQSTCIYDITFSMQFPECGNLRWLFFKLKQLHLRFYDGSRVSVVR